MVYNKGSYWKKTETKKSCFQLLFENEIKNTIKTEINDKTEIAKHMNSFFVNVG